MSVECEDLFWIIDYDFKLVNANSAFLKLKNYTETDHQLPIVDEPDLTSNIGINSKWHELYKKSMNGENISIREKMYNPFKRKTENRLITFNPVFDIAGVPYGVSCFAKNITEETIHQIKLETDNLELDKILDSSPDIICTINEAGQFIKVSAACERLLGYTPAELLGKPYIRFVYTDDQQKANETASMVMSGIEVTNFENRYIRKNGSLAPMIWSARWNAVEKIMYCVAKDAQELHKVEDAVKEQRQQYTDLFMQAPVFICIVKGPNHVFNMANPSYHMLTGKIDLIGKTVGEVFPGLKSQGFLKILDAVYVTGLPFISNEMLIKFDQESKGDLIERYITFSCQAHRDSQKRIEGIFIFGTDVTETVRARTSMEEKNKRYHYVSQATSDAIWDWDLFDNSIYRGERYQEIFGRGLRDADISSWKNRIHPDDLKQTVENLFEVIHGTESNWTSEYRYLKKDQDYAFVLDKGFVIRDEKGKAVRMVGAMRDITRRKAEEQQLKLLGSVITNTNDAVIIIEAERHNYIDQKIIYVNNAFTSITGYTSEEAIGKTKAFFFGPKSDFEGLKLLDEAILNNKPYEFNSISYKKNGTEFWINFDLNPVTNENNVVTHWIVLAKDITEWKNKEIEKNLLVEISNFFREEVSLNTSISKVLVRLISIGAFSMGEVWLTGNDPNKVHKVAQHAQSGSENIYGHEDLNENNFAGRCQAGLIYKGKSDQEWQNIDQQPNIKTPNVPNDIEIGYRMPILNNDTVTGFLIFVLQTAHKLNDNIPDLFKALGTHIGVEIKRKQLEQELNLIFTYAPDIISIVGLDGYFKKINPAACTLLEYSQDELMAVPFITFIHPDDKKRSMEKIRDLDRRKSIFLFENRYLTKSGKVKWLSWTSSPTLDGEFVFSVAKDITDKKELENLFNKATRLANMGSWELDLLKESLYWSEITREIHEVELDFQPSLETGMNFYKSGTSRALIGECVQQAINNGTPWDQELQIVTLNNKEKWIRVIGEAEFAKGKCTKLYGSFQDIDIRKKAELAAIQTLIDKNVILESIGDAFFAVDKGWKITYWNKQAEIILGKTKDKTIGFNLWDVYSDSLHSESYKRYHLAMENNQVVHFEDYYEPVEKWYEISVYPVNSGLSVYFKDITERKYSQIQLLKLNENLQKQAKALALSNKELEQFAYVASHDLQEPLRMITSFLTLLEKKYHNIIDAKGKSYIDFAVDGAKRMRQIILDLLEFSRVGKAEDGLENLNLNEILAEIKFLFRNTIVEKNAIIESDLLPSIHANRSPLRQIFQNLIGNALKYTKPGTAPLVKISCRDEITYWHFSVKDNGIGVNPEYFDRIFVIFQRLHTKEQYPGSGMGLALTKKIIENYGGKIWLDSEEGLGTTFHFTLLK